jgi:hypothetical protein
MNGVQRYYLDEDIPSTDSGFRQLVQKNQLEWFHDFRFAKRIAQNYTNTQSLSDMFG